MHPNFLKMKFLRFLLPSLLLALLVIPACDETFDLNADYEDITVVYGLIDPKEDTLFVRINKAFLGEGNALVMAKVEDSSVYKTDLSAIVNEMNGNEILRTFQMDTLNLYNKEDGVFYNPHQLVYYTVIDGILDYRGYDLIVNVNNKVVKGSTLIVRDFNLEKPAFGLTTINIKYGVDFTTEWLSAVNGKRYEVAVRFHFKELWEGNPDTVLRYEDWYLGAKKSKDTEGGESMTVIFKGDSFYAWLEDAVEYDDPAQEAKVTWRGTESLEWIVAAASEDLNTYMEVNEPSNSIVQEKPEYTNIENGLGIFSSRNSITRVKRIHPETVTNIKNLPTDLKFEY